MSAREELYAALMAGGPHSPARSEKASRLIDAMLTEAGVKYLTCTTCGAGYEVGGPCGTCEFNARMAAETGEQSSREADATPELTIYRASHDSIVMGLYTTRQAAYEHCEAYEMRDDPVSPMSWTVDEDGVAELVRIRIPRSPGAESPTGYVVTPLEVASAYDEEADE